jgi:hypothetical protein
MVASMFRLFGYWEFGKRAWGSSAQLRPAAPAAYCDALLASWVPSLPEIRAVAGQDKPLTNEAKSDAEAFLARVYLNQRC